MTNCAIEPEVKDLTNFLIKLGCNVKWIGKRSIKIVGVSDIKQATYSVMFDRIEAGTYLIAAAITEGNLKIKNIIPGLLKTEIDILKKIGVKIITKNKEIKIIGNKNKFPKRIKRIINHSEDKTKKNKKLHINLAINYGSKSEIVESIKRILKNKQNVSEKKISSNLYTSHLPDPDILIRTGNTKRLSNFLLWQLAYSEIFFEKKLWPDFDENDYLKILNKFKLIKRNFGRI